MIASFILRFHSARRDNLEQTLRFMTLWHSEIVQQSELITVCQDKFDHEIDSSSWAAHKHFDMQIQEMHLPYVTNFGVDASECEKIVVMDSDRLLPAGYFSKVLALLSEGVQITTHKTKKLQIPHSDEQIINDDLNFKWDFRDMFCGWPDSKVNYHMTGEGKNVWSGNTAFMKSDFIKAGKMDEKYIGYGYEDNDMTLGMQKIGVKSVYLEEEIELHLWHEPLTYGVRDQKKMYIDNGVRFCKKWGRLTPQYLREEMIAYRKFMI